MAYYASPYSGTGTHADPFVPLAAVGRPGASSLDLRPDPRVVTGFALVSIPGFAGAINGCRKIADFPDDLLSVQDSNWIKDNLDPGRERATFRQTAGLLLRRPPDGKWKALMPVLDGLGARFEVFLGELLYTEPIVGGGADDNFNRANETPLAAPWVKNNGTSCNLVSNTVRAVAPSADNIQSYTDAAMTANQYSQATALSIPSNDWGPAVRCSGSDPTGNCYTYDVFGASQIVKYVGGAHTTLATASAGGYADGQVVRITANGSTVNATRNGTPVFIPPQTDTSLTTGQPGMYIFEAGSGGVDNWQGGDLAASPAPRPHIIYLRVNR